MAPIRRGSRRGQHLYDAFAEYGFGEISHPRPRFPGNDMPVNNIRVDWKETPEEHVFIADVPGVNKELVKVVLDDGRVLQISGERQEDGHQSDKCRCLERMTGNFSRKFKLPDNAMLDEVQAEIKDGVLTVIVRKKEVKAPRVTAITIIG